MSINHAAFAQAAMKRAKLAKTLKAEHRALGWVVTSGDRGRIAASGFRDEAEANKWIDDQRKGKGGPVYRETFNV